MTISDKAKHLVMVIVLGGLCQVKRLGRPRFEKLRVNITKLSQMLNLELRCGAWRDWEPLLYQVGGRPTKLLRLLTVCERIIWKRLEMPKNQGG